MTTTVAAPAAPSALARSGAGVKLLALAAGFVMAIVDTTVINVAGARIQHHLELSLAGLTWVVDGYTLTFASLLLLAGALANRFGAKPVYLWGTGIFVAASACCGLAPSGPVLIIGRLVQGVGAAACMPSSLALLANSFPDPKQRARMVGLWSSIISASAAVGPVLGGVLVGTIGWRGIFLLNLPIGGAGLLLTSRLIEPMAGRAVRPALLNHGLSMTFLAGACFALINGHSYGWSSTPIVAAMAVAAASVVLFLWRERKVAEPVLPGALFRQARFSATNGISFLLNFGLFGMIYMLGLFFQNGRGAGPIEAGFQMLPLWGVFVVGNLVFTRIVAKVGTRWLMVAGLGVAAVATMALAGVSQETPYWVLGVLMAVSSLCIGVAVPAMTTSLMEAAGKENANVAGSTLNATRQIGTLMGVAVVGIVLSVTTDWYHSAGTTFILAACCFLTSSLLAWKFARGVSAS